MTMQSLLELETFVAIAEERSLTGAARRLGRSLQAVSRGLQTLESEMGATLVVRTTRTSRLSDAGERFYKRVKAILADLEIAQTELAEDARRLTGRLRVNAPTLFGPRFVVPLVSEFLQRHPDLSAAVTLSDEFNDPATSGADVTVRIGATPDSRLVARKLADVRRVAFASASYLAAHGHPRTPEDLASHACVVRTGMQNPYRWNFKARTGAEVSVAVGGRFESDQVAAVNGAVLGGLGVGLAAFWQIRDALDAGHVSVVLPEYEPSPLPLFALWPRTRKMPARTRLLIDFLAARLAGEKL
ncbi:LysR family transcriptional regulator [Trinickia dinghuensis]|uniref:LysR family transcriptional regulator n=1 Tax=Trinickia dinghuensis TaxID=2291023 RepID=A0A3D8K0C2_9BURK|nr:LysR family transcriptional regulator [Trinickia dinghuensis]RDU98699.1 LysR family transcriptional regulator [Trinickia dinghuensis]